MSSRLYLSLSLIAVAFSVTLSTARVIPAEPVSMVLDAYGRPVLFLREKRAPITSPIVPHRSMMFTGYYRPSRRSYSSQEAAGAVFAQGNAVSGASYLSGGVPHLKTGPSPIDEPEISSSQAEASPGSETGYEIPSQEDQRRGEEENINAASPPEEQPEIQASEPEQIPYDIEAPAAPETGVDQQEPVSPIRPVKKGKKTPIFDQEEDEDDEDIEDEDEVPQFIPGKGKRRQQGRGTPNLNNFFPVMFSFPGLSRRGGGASGSGSQPGIVTAIANSYSTGKGGVASSVATAYGGSPTGKKARRAPHPIAEE